MLEYGKNEEQFIHFRIVEVNTLPISNSSMFDYIIFTISMYIVT